MAKVTIEMEREEFNDLLKAVDFGAAWMDEYGYYEDQKKFKTIYNKLKEL